MALAREKLKPEALSILLEEVSFTGTDAAGVRPAMARTAPLYHPDHGGSAAQMGRVSSATRPPSMLPRARNPGAEALRGSGDTVKADRHAVQNWFDGLTDGGIPRAEGTLATAPRTADVLARLANAENTRRAYRAGVRARCAWCDRHGLPALPAAPADVAAFLSEQRYPAPLGKPLGVNTLKLRAAAMRYLHYLARLPSSSGTADVGETLTGITRVARQAGQGPKPKLAARIALLREMTAWIGEDLPGVRDRALLLGVAGTFCRAELARIEMAHLEDTEHGLPITLPSFKGDQGMAGVQVRIPYGGRELCPVRALRR